MEEKVVEDFIQTLARVGLQGSEIEKQIWQQVNAGLSSFTVDFKKEYGQERMQYELYIEKCTDESETLYLKFFRATHRSPIKVDRMVINGVDTASLDEEMALVDWQLYWYGNSDAMEPDKQQQVSDIMRKLTKLYKSDDILGMEFQQLLIYKYWPDEYYEINRKPVRHELKSVYEVSENFMFQEASSVTTDLAYLILSDRYSELMSQFLEIGLNRITEIDKETMLRKLLSDNPDSFHFEGAYNTPEGFVAFGIPVQKKDGWYTFDTYEISFTPYPEPQNGIYNGIDTAMLDARIQEISWNSPGKLFVFHENSEPEFRPGPYDLVEELNRLKQTKEGAEVAAVLELKYLRNVVFYGDNISERAWELLEELPERKNSFPADENINAAVNAMAGRAVLIVLNNDIHQEMDTWYSLDFSKRCGDGTYASRLIKGYCVKNVEEHLRMLPIFGHCFYSIRDELLAGDKVRTPLTDDREIIIEAVPEQATLQLYTPDMLPIPFNFRIDHNWKPEHNLNLKQELPGQKDKISKVVQVNYNFKKSKRI